MKRRNFLKAGAISLAASGIGSWFLFRKSREQLLYEALCRELFYLKISAEDGRRFAADLAGNMERVGNVKNARMYAYRLYASYYRSTAWPIGAGGAHRNYEAFNHFVVVTFLLSSDFFLNGANEALPVRYTGLYKPGAFPCINPFS